MKLINEETAGMGHQRWTFAAGRNEIELLMGLLEAAKRSTPAMDETVPMRSRFKQMHREFQLALRATTLAPAERGDGEASQAQQPKSVGGGSAPEQGGGSSIPDKREDSGRPLYGIPPEGRIIISAMVTRNTTAIEYVWNEEAEREIEIRNHIARLLGNTHAELVRNGTAVEEGDATAKPDAAIPQKCEQGGGKTEAEEALIDLVVSLLRDGCSKLTQFGNAAVTSLAQRVAAEREQGGAE